jgi:pantoate--beta-alanine ligase
MSDPVQDLSAAPDGQAQHAAAAPVLLRTRADLRAAMQAERAAGRTLGFVPTMGALHDGHLSLLRIAAQHADRTLVSIFVNPTQFAPTEDLARYPRSEVQDISALAEAGCHFVFAPPVEEMYPAGSVTRVRVPGVSEPLEGEFRPHFFEGVATVVAKLLTVAGADVAVFGEKDWQQLQVIRRLVEDLCIPTRILAGPTLREPDGLAMSSRNAYLTAVARQQAIALPRALDGLAAFLAAGGDIADGTARAAAALLEAGFASVDYIAVADPATLAPLGPGPLAGPARLLAAAWLDGTRLIDNRAA